MPTRLRILRRAVLRSALALALLHSCSEPPAAPRPDVIVVVVDTLRADVALGPELGPRWAPALNALAAGALVFDNAWSTSSWTAPATASLFTGLYPDQHRVETGLRAHRDPLELEAIAAGRATRAALAVAPGPARIPRAAETLATFLAERGYRTLGVADNPNIGDELGFTRGFDRFVTMKDGTAAGITKVVRGWRADLEGDAPVFLYLHFMDPHKPYAVHERWYAEPGPASPDDPYARLRAAYHSEVRWLDERLAALLRELGGIEDALFVFTADHGEEFGDHGGMGHGVKLYSELTRVPLVLRLPGADPPRGRSDEPVSLIDVLPTVRDFLGAPSDPRSPGRSLLELARGGSFGARPLFAMRKWSGGERERLLVLAEGHALITTPHAERIELYDLAADPEQLNNLAEADAERVTRLTGLLHEYRENAFRHTEELGPSRRQTREEAAFLERLGYAGDE